MHSETSNYGAPNNIYSWEFNDDRNRWSLWYVIALSVVIWLSIWGVFSRQYWMSFIVLLIAWLAYFIENNSEDLIKVKISSLWVKISWTFYDFTWIWSFWIVYKWDEPVSLRFNLKKKWLKNIDVKIDASNISKIKEILSNYIEETPKIELTFTEKVIKLLKL